MTASYNDPVSIPRDGIRTLLGDTDMSQPLLQDEEIDYILSLWTEQTNPYFQAAYCAEAIAAKFAREINFTADGQNVGADVLQQKYLDLATQLRIRGAAAFPGTVYVGGIDPWEGFDPTVIPPTFGKQMHDNPEAGQEDFGDIKRYRWDRWWEYL